MRILITGATGFLGSAAAKALLAEGHSVIGLTHRAEKMAALRAAGLLPVIGDMRRPETYVPLVPHVDAVLHVAQRKLTGRWSCSKLAVMHQADATMTRALAEACSAQARTLIYTSGALTHAGYAGEWVEEAMPARPCFAAQGHAAMEQELLDMHRARGLDVRIVSPGFVYGLGGMFAMTLEMLLAGRYAHIGAPNNWWSLVHVEDVAQAYVRALHHGQAGDKYFLSDGQPFTRQEIIRALCRVWRLPEVKQVPGWLMGLALGFPMVEAISASVRLTGHLARTRLGWKPRFTTFEQALPVLARQWQGYVAERVAA